MGDALSAQMVDGLQELQQHQGLLPAAGLGPCQELSQRVGVTRTQNQTEQGPVRCCRSWASSKGADQQARFQEPPRTQTSPALLLHDQEEGAVVAQTGWVEPGREHVWVLLQGSREQRDSGREHATHADDVGVSLQPFHRSEVPANTTSQHQNRTEILAAAAGHSPVQDNPVLQIQG